MPPNPELSLRERKQRKTREAILAAAMDLFAERGFDRVTVDEIAARAEVGRTTFFRYLTDKQELLADIRRKRPKDGHQPHPAELTGPAPSGMTTTHKGRGSLSFTARGRPRRRCPVRCGACRS